MFQATELPGWGCFLHFYAVDSGVGKIVAQWPVEMCSYYKVSTIINVLSIFKMTNLILKYCCLGKFSTYSSKSLAVGIINIWICNHNPSQNKNYLYLALTMCQTLLKTLNTYHPFSSLTQYRRHALLLCLIDKWGNFRIPDSLICPGTHSESVGKLEFKPRNSDPRGKPYYQWHLKSQNFLEAHFPHPWE